MKVVFVGWRCRKPLTAERGTDGYSCVGCEVESWPSSTKTPTPSKPQPADTQTQTKTSQTSFQEP